jgi:hypothetical protein
MVQNGCPIPRKDGAACQARPTKSGYCLSHDPGLAEKRHQARVRGGRGKARTLRARKFLLAEFESWDALVDLAAAQVYQGVLASNVATAIASLAGAKVKFFETSIRLWEFGEAREKLATLEAKVEELLKSGAVDRNGRRLGARNGF